MQPAPYLIQDGITLPGFWFEAPRAREIIAEAIRTNGACFDQEEASAPAHYADQREIHVEFSGPLIDELAAMRKEADDKIERYFRLQQKFDRVSIAKFNTFKRIIADHWTDYYRVQLAQPVDVLLCALGWAPRGGGAHLPALEAAVERVVSGSVDGRAAA